ncbi:hypothetical protein HMPREF0762_01623 [Slackia exigua ATCC 700122]|uniref:Transposase DDE domain-containing protein n=1 Tax=Slackia exigua (strain ATCC 700122 / DSM 15923 / CIP 105133 / JCM 11022 / KCTC 5966 / S-7) TaxID=649764 RepID=D0WIE8_SLAES|nr:hypothetical protein HMPREF0762_01623 [Slackia exigua ATCC 700122]
MGYAVLKSPFASRFPWARSRVERNYSRMRILYRKCRVEGNT